MFWMLILFFWNTFKTIKKFFRSNIEVVTQFNQCSKGNITLSLFNPSNMNICLVKTLELGQAFLQPKLLCSCGKPPQ